MFCSWTLVSIKLTGSLIVHVMKNELHRSTLKTIQTINGQKLRQQNKEPSDLYSIKKNIIIRNTLFSARIANRFIGYHACWKCNTCALKVAMFMCRLRCMTCCGFHVWCIFDKPVILLEFRRLLYSERQRQIIRGTNTYVKVVMHKVIFIHLYFTECSSLWCRQHHKVYC